MTIRSEVIDLIDPLVGGYVSADRNEVTVYPQITVLDHISEVAELRGDSRAQAWRRLVQVDLWQKTDDESPVLLDELLDVLDGAQLDDGLRVAVTSSNRVPDPDLALVHHAVTCRVARLR